MSAKDRQCTMDRRIVLSGLASLVIGISSDSVAASEPLRLVLVHGRGQQGLDPQQLKATWMETFHRGAEKLGRTFPDTVDVAFPYYGDTLDRFAREYDIPLTSDIQARGQANDEFLAFQAEVAEALRERSGVTDAQVDAEYGANPKPKGPLNWEWVHAILRALDKHGGGMRQEVLELFTRDVFLYTTRAGVRDEIDRIVSSAITEQPTIVVGHSLGSIVAYSVLRRDSRSLRVPLLLTVGCPLGIRAVRDQFRPLRFPLPVKVWVNAFDTRDVVALYPLDGANFPVTPAVENYSKVRNSTDNRHGIIGYLDDAEVSKRVLDVLGA